MKKLWNSNTCHITFNANSPPNEQKQVEKEVTIFLEEKTNSNSPP